MARRVLAVIGGVVFMLWPWVTAGFGTPIGIGVAAGLLRSRLLGLAAFGFLVAVIVGLVAGAGEDTPTEEAVSLAGLLTSWAGGGVLAAILAAPVVRVLRGRRNARANGPPGDDAPDHAGVTAQVAAETRVAVARDPAMRRALRRRTRRELAREIVTRDPALATELAIGRPDLPREFKDGGLIDVNGVAARVLAGLPGFDPAMAERVVAARQRHGPLTSAAELVVYADVPNEVVAALRDRLLFRAH